jgi:DNA-binding PadR family transcriptional regulator
MKRPLLKHPANRAKQTAALLLDFNKVRILHDAASGPVSRLSLTQKLQSHGCSVSLATLERVLLRMVRNGWLASKKPALGTPTDYSLTAKGRVVLNAARNHLKTLAATLHDPRRQQIPRVKADTTG